MLFTPKCSTDLRTLSREAQNACEKLFVGDRVHDLAGTIGMEKVFAAWLS